MIRPEREIVRSEILSNGKLTEASDRGVREVEWIEEAGLNYL